VAVLPRNGHSAPSYPDDLAMIGLILLPADLRADLQRSGLFAGHGFAVNISTRFISLWPEKLLWPSHLIVTYLA
jgi:hypothetical protein